MPTALPVTAVTMNYASVVLVGFGVIAALWYAVHSRKGMSCCDLQGEKQRLTKIIKLTKARRHQKVCKRTAASI